MIRDMNMIIYQRSLQELPPQRLSLQPLQPLLLLQPLQPILSQKLQPLQPRPLHVFQANRASVNIHTTTKAGNSLCCIITTLSEMKINI